MKIVCTPLSYSACSTCPKTNAGPSFLGAQRFPKYNFGNSSEDLNFTSDKLYRNFTGYGDLMWCATEVLFCECGCPTWKFTIRPHVFEGDERGTNDILSNRKTLKRNYLRLEHQSALPTRGPAPFMTVPHHV
ncbi:hypothetical protein AVEN_249140-1 [Araneus ventricosus]|uniref:Uncharacterized protein n=1 Tax=Araneus ventricosus TaxID=182803 RepID=A0A4Y2D5Y8_ARAVE|nr:hypothetical protein AVEN_249140-1 [Araneus ventricosus]